jgi:hypothetical protein
MWKIFKKYKNNNVETFYFKEVAKRDSNGVVIDFNGFKNTKVKIDKEKNLFYFDDNKEVQAWKIISSIVENVEFNLKTFTVETTNFGVQKIIIFNNSKMTIRSEDLDNGVKHIYGKSGSLYEEHCELLHKMG